MQAPVTLKKLLEDHPEWSDPPLTVYRDDKTVHWVGASGDVYTGEPDEKWVKPARELCASLACAVGNEMAKGYVVKK